MVQFQIIAHTQTGESIGLVGSTPELGAWDVEKCILLRTSPERYPQWWTETDISFTPSSQVSEFSKVEYKYLRFFAEGDWEWEYAGANRWFPLTVNPPSGRLVIEDGMLGYGQPYPFGYVETTPPSLLQRLSQTFSPRQGLKVLILGSSVAAGHKAWLLNGWAAQLAQSLQERYGHRVVNVSESGANVTRTIERFPTAVVPEKPDVVIIALSLGNEGLALCSDHSRRAVQRRFESGLRQLVKMVQALGARPILGAVYPHDDYTPEHYALLKDTHCRMLAWGVPVLNWFDPIQDGQGHWRPGISFDPAHPNTLGHRLMYEAIDQTLFQIDRAELNREKQRYQQQNEDLVYLDASGFRVATCRGDRCLRITNSSLHPYTIAPHWQTLQTAVQQKASLPPGIYLAKNAPKGTLPYLAVSEQGTITTQLDIPPVAHLEYNPAVDLFTSHNAQVLFFDGHLGLLKESDRSLIVVNETQEAYNIHPMWKEIRQALKLMPPGIYEDLHHPDVPFRTLIIGADGLESRVKAPPQSALRFQFTCPLSERSRIAILPLGDRCAVRMLLYKMEYDGPAFPFDLTRTTKVSDVADMIENQFFDMWSPDYLDYSPEAGRIYHRKWSGLSFAHEVDDTDDPIHNMNPIWERMKTRYQARAERFWYTLQHCDEMLFVRTGLCDRGSVEDLIQKLAKYAQGKPFRLLILSAQASEEFAGLAQVIHYQYDFNPDHMYDDLGYWLHCTEIMRGILEFLGVTSQNLFWCPPNPPQSPSLKNDALTSQSHTPDAGERSA